MDTKGIQRSSKLYLFAFTSTRIYLLTSHKNLVQDLKVDHVNQLGISLIKYTITNTYPHNIEYYTEGLIVHDNKLFESTETHHDLLSVGRVGGVCRAGRLLADQLPLTFIPPAELIFN